MIVKNRNIPLIVQKLEALYRRTPQNHPRLPLIKDHLTKNLIGYKGEASLDYPLSFLPPKEYYIFHGLRLAGEHYHFQIDTLLLSRKFILILEVKNYSGKVYFDEEFHQMIRTLDGEDKAFPNPLIQIQRQQQQLENWFENNQLPKLPIHSFVVFSNPYTIIRKSSQSKYLTEKVIRSESLPTKINSIEAKYRSHLLTEKEVKKITRKMNKQHTEVEIPILEQFDLTKNQLIQGVFCPSCRLPHMKRANGYWLCNQCNTKSRDAHIAAIHDYTLLIQQSFNIQEIKSFLQINSTKTTNRLIRSLPVSYTGITNDRTYTLNLEND